MAEAQIIDSHNSSKWNGEYVSFPFLVVGVKLNLKQSREPLLNFFCLVEAGPKPAAPRSRSITDYFKKFLPATAATAIPSSASLPSPVAAVPLSKTCSLASTSTPEASGSGIDHAKSRSISRGSTSDSTGEGAGAELASSLNATSPNAMPALASKVKVKLPPPQTPRTRSRTKSVQPLETSEKDATLSASPASSVATLDMTLDSSSPFLIPAVIHITPPESNRKEREMTLENLPSPNLNDLEQTPSRAATTIPLAIRAQSAAPSSASKDKGKEREVTPVVSEAASSSAINEPEEAPIRRSTPQQVIPIHSLSPLPSILHEREERETTPVQTPTNARSLRTTFLTPSSPSTIPSPETSSLYVAGLPSTPAPPIGAAEPFSSPLSPPGPTPPYSPRVGRHRGSSLIPHSFTLEIEVRPRKSPIRPAVKVELMDLDEESSQGVRDAYGCSGSDREAEQLGSEDENSSATPVYSSESESDGEFAAALARAAARRQAGTALVTVSTPDIPPEVRRSSRAKDVIKPKATSAKSTFESALKHDMGGSGKLGMAALLKESKIAKAKAIEWEQSKSMMAEDDDLDFVSSD